MTKGDQRSHENDTAELMRRQRMKNQKQYRCAEKTYRHTDGYIHLTRDALVRVVSAGGGLYFYLALCHVNRRAHYQAESFDPDQNAVAGLLTVCPVYRNKSNLAPSLISVTS